MTHLRGKFIVFDGGEGCGKSTQARLLSQELESTGLQPMLVRDPGSTRIGELIRAILLNPDHLEMGMRCEMLLYMGARAQMMKQTILPALAEGKVVISDRFVSSTLAYQVGGDGLTADEIRQVADIALDHRWPDLTMIFDMPVAVSRNRVRGKFEHREKTLFGETVTVTKDRIELRPEQYHETVRQNYLNQTQTDPQRYRVIDASQPIEKVHQDVMQQLKGWKDAGKRRSAAKSK